MAACMQQLHMMPTLTAGLLKASPSKASSHSEMLSQLQLLLAQLSLTDRAAIEPDAYCLAFRDFDGECLSPLEQRDADEYLHTLFQRIEDSFGQVKLLDALFGGILVQQVLWEADDAGSDAAPPTAAAAAAAAAAGGAANKSERSEPFRVLQLEIQSCATVEAALDAYVEGEAIRGYEVPGGQTVDAIKRTCLGKLPHTLIVQLKRFTFDYDSMVKLKLYDHCAFGPRLRIESRHLACGQGGCTYALVGVVVHVGDGEYGHYYSYVRERASGGRAGLGLTGGDGADDGADGAAKRSGRWVLFNDSVVREVKAEEAWTWEGAGSATTPYLLFYERETPEEAAEAEAAAEAERKAEAEATKARAAAGGKADAAPASAEASAAVEGDAGGAGGQWALDEVCSDNASLRRRAHVFSAAHLICIERLLAEQVIAI